jgi:hypothetical protein
VNKMQGMRNLEKIKGIFNVMEMTGQHLMERPVPSANGDFEVTA